MRVLIDRITRPLVRGRGRTMIGSERRYVHNLLMVVQEMFGMSMFAMGSIGRGVDYGIQRYNDTYSTKPRSSSHPGCFAIHNPSIALALS